MNLLNNFYELDIKDILYKCITKRKVLILTSWPTISTILGNELAKEGNYIFTYDKNEFMYLLLVEGY